LNWPVENQIKFSCFVGAKFQGTQYRPLAKRQYNRRPSKKGFFLYYEIGIETLLSLTMEQQIKYAFLYRRL
jgi:hypothetical protein